MMYPYQIRYQKPRLYWIVRILFPSYDFRNHYLTFYRTIYVSKGINEASLAHELVHVQQQGSSRLHAILHVIKYRLSSNFRYQSELAGYRAEYNAFKHKTHNSRNENFYLVQLTNHLMNPIYGFENSTKNFYKIIQDIKA